MVQWNLFRCLHFDISSDKFNNFPLIRKFKDTQILFEAELAIPFNPLICWSLLYIWLFNIWEPVRSIFSFSNETRTWCIIFIFFILLFYFSLRKIYFVIFVPTFFTLMFSFSILVNFLCFESNIEQVLATTPHETPTIRPLASHHENYTS